MSKTVVAHLLEYAEEASGDLYHLWGRGEKSSISMAKSFQEVIGEYIDNLVDDPEDDDARLCYLLSSLIEDLTRDELFELGTGLLHIQENR